MLGTGRILVAFALAVVLNAQEFLVIPGERVGPVDKTSTRASLALAVAAGEISDGTMGFGEAEAVPVTFLFKTDPTRTLAVAFGSNGSPEFVAICPLPENVSGRQRRCRWHTPDGVTLGTTLRQLVARNGSDFTFLGFGWDYDGFVTSWERGKLRSYKNCAGLSVRLATSDLHPTPKSVTGDKPVSSHAPALRNLDVHVSEMRLTLLCR